MDEVALELLRRHSGLTLSKDGAFAFHGAPVENPRVQALFHRGLSVRGDGEVVLSVGRQWAYVACEGVTRFVDRLSVREGTLRLVLRGGQKELAARPALAVAPDDRIYLWSDETAAPALLGRQAHHQLSELLVEGRDGVPSLRLATGVAPVAALPAAPGPTDPPPRTDDAAGSGTR